MRRHFYFLLAGFFLGGLSLAAAFNWLAVCQMVLHKPLLTPADQPPYFETLRHVATYLPVIGVVLIFAWRIVRGSGVKAATFTVGAFLPHAFLLLYSWYGPALLITWHNESFDAAKWRASSDIQLEEKWPERLRMVDDLLRQKKLDGLTRKSVEQMLGPGVLNLHFPRSENEVAYYLGPQRDFWRDGAEYLTIRFDQKQIVQDYSIEVD